MGDVRVSRSLTGHQWPQLGDLQRTECGSPTMARMQDAAARRLEAPSLEKKAGCVCIEIGANTRKAEARETAPILRSVDWSSGSRRISDG